LELAQQLEKIYADKEIVCIIHAGVHAQHKKYDTAEKVLTVIFNLPNFFCFAMLIFNQMADFPCQAPK
jgi:hypothetical protein